MHKKANWTPSPEDNNLDLVDRDLINEKEVKKLQFLTLHK
jgi:hypothetical protein